MKSHVAFTTGVFTERISIGTNLPIDLKLDTTVCTAEYENNQLISLTATVGDHEITVNYDKIQDRLTQRYRRAYTTWGDSAKELTFNARGVILEALLYDMQQGEELPIDRGTLLEDLSGEDFRFANFQSLNLSGANFSGSHLEGANFKCTNLEGCLFQGSNLSLVNLTSTKIDPSSLRSMIDAETLTFLFSPETGSIIFTKPKNLSDTDINSFLMKSLRDLETLVKDIRTYEISKDSQNAMLSRIESHLKGLQNSTLIWKGRNFDLLKNEIDSTTKDFIVELLSRTKNLLYNTNG